MANASQTSQHKCFYACACHGANRVVKSRKSILDAESFKRVYLAMAAVQEKRVLDLEAAQDPDAKTAEKQMPAWTWACGKIGRTHIKLQG